MKINFFCKYIGIIFTTCLVCMCVYADDISQSKSAKEMRRLREKQMDKAKHELMVLYEDFLSYKEQKKPRIIPKKFEPRNPLIRIMDDMVVIDAIASGDPEVLKKNLESLGMKRAVIYRQFVSGWLPIDSIKKMNALESLKIVRPSYAVHHAGRVTSQGDGAMKADVARDTTGVDGTGFTVGVLSDSFNCLGDGGNDITNDDLPDEITVLDEVGSCLLGSDEGRAMMQIIHDIAPGASLAFHTAYNGMADFAVGIIELREEADADIIVDDIIYLAEPMFQDGIIAQAVDHVKDLGAAYFSSAGNAGRDSYQAFFEPSGSSPVFFGEPHDFDTSSGVDIYQNITVPEGTGIDIVLQWDSPFFSESPPGSPNDLDIFLLDDSLSTVLAYSIDKNIGGDPVEMLYFENPFGSGRTDFNIVIEKVRGPNPRLMKYVIFNFEGTINEYDTSSGTIYGHANAAGAMAVGAAAYYDTPEYGVDPAELESYSSAGPMPVIFDEFGSFITPEIRKKPEIVSIDGVNTTFFGTDTEPDGFPNFFGTSAAAPHAAGVAALMLEANPLLTPDDIYSILKNTASDMGDSGFDFDSGYGLIQADKAVEEAELQ